jgi:DNA-binding transcriptional LysR family regulator
VIQSAGKIGHAEFYEPPILITNLIFSANLYILRHNRSMSSPLYSRQLLAFVTVAEELHFGRAAERLHMSQPPLSQLIRRFEKEVGTSLFLRTTRSVKLTPAGQILFDCSRNLIDQGHAMLIGVRQVATGQRGILTLGFTSTAAFDALPRAISAYRKRYPNVRLLLHEQKTSSELWQELLAGRLDAALLRRQTSMNDSGFRFISVGREPLVVAMPARHRMASLAKVRLADLRDEPFIAFAERKSHYFHALIGALFDRAGFAPRIVTESVLPTMLALVEAGVGVALVPESAATVRRGKLAFRQLRGAHPAAELHIALPVNGANAAAGMFAAIAAQACRRRKNIQMESVAD